MNKSKALFLSSLLVLGMVVPASDVLMSQNFDSGFTPGELTGSQKFSGGDYLVQAEPGSMQIVESEASKPYALKVGRNGVVGFTTFRSAARVPEGKDFLVSFKIKVPQNNSVVAFLGEAGQEPTGALLLTGGVAPQAYDSARKWRTSGMAALAPDQWVTVETRFDVRARSYEVTVVTPDGKRVTGVNEFPFLRDGGVSEIRFINCLPQGNYALIDDLVLSSVERGADAVELPPGIVLQENFDTGFSAGALSGGGRNAGAKWLVDADAGNYSIVTEPVNSSPFALKVMRDGRNGYFALRPLLRIPAKRNYAIEFMVYPPPGSGTVLHLANGNGLVGGILVQAGTSPQGYNISQSWEPSGKMAELPPNAWSRIRIEFNVNQQYYTVSATLPDGKTFQGTTQHPCLNGEPVSELRFVNILPQKSFVFVDNVSMNFDQSVSMDGRDDFAASATSTDPDFAAMLRDGKPFTPGNEPVEMEFSPPVKINAVKFTAAPGKSLPSGVKLRALNAGGHWIDLGENTIDPETGGIVEFATTDKTVKLAMTFTSVPDAALTAIGVYSPVGTPQGTLDREWAKKLDAEYRLPVYDRQYSGCDRAELTLINHTDAVLELAIDLHERLADRHFRTLKHTAPPGSSALFIDLNELPNGEYVTTISDATSEKSGRLLRLLRHWTAPECAAVPRTEIGGEKIFFPDDFYLIEHNNIRFTTDVATPHLVKRGTTDNDSFIVMGDNIGFDAEGKLCVNFHTLNRLWQVASSNSYHAVTSPDDLNGWQVSPGTVQLADSPNPLNGDIPEAARPDWNQKPGPDGKITYRFYDPERDGEVKLNQVQCQFISPAAPGTVGYNDYNWGVMIPSAATVWTVWYKSPGEALILGRKPLISGFPPSGGLEPPDSGSDLGFGQWLEDDGKTLCFGFGRHLIRYAPYRAEYDNMPDRNRIVGIWRTRDGLNWEQGYIAPPDLSKPVADQHYGGKQLRVPGGAGLRISFLLRYSALYQQISWEIIYSWDGFRWTRFQREPQFCSNGPLGDWTHGGGYLSDSAVEYNGKVYQLMYWINDHYHFQSEIVHSSVNSVDHMTADYMKQRYSPRQLEKWPYFEKHFGGSWEKLAEHTRNANSSVGVLEYRKDGFFHAEAGDTPGHMITHPVSAPGGMSVNAVIGDDGFIEFTLLADGKPINGFKRRLESGDGIALPVFEKLPEGKFQIDMKLKNARIYTLNF